MKSDYVMPNCLSYFRRLVLGMQVWRDWEFESPEVVCTRLGSQVLHNYLYNIFFPSKQLYWNLLLNNHLPIKKKIAFFNTHVPN